MDAYHEINPDVLEATLVNGLKRTSRGEKGDDPSIIAADKFLDENCPETLREQGASRQNNLYAYMQHDGNVVSIDDGRFVPVGEFIEQSSQAVIRLEVDPKRCFVSDLDTFDAVKSALEDRIDQLGIDKLAKSYWSKLTPLNEYAQGNFRRPEIMVTYDVSATNIKKVSQ